MKGDIAALHEAIKRDVGNDSLWLEMADALDDAGKLHLGSLFRRIAGLKTIVSALNAESDWRFMRSTDNIEPRITKKFDLFGLPAALAKVAEKQALIMGSYATPPAYLICLVGKHEFPSILEELAGHECNQ